MPAPLHTHNPESYWVKKSRATVMYINKHGMMQHKSCSFQNDRFIIVFQIKLVNWLYSEIIPVGIAMGTGLLPPTAEIIERTDSLRCGEARLPETVHRTLSKSRLSNPLSSPTTKNRYPFG